MDAAFAEDADLGDGSSWWAVSAGSGKMFAQVVKVGFGFDLGKTSRLCEN